MLIFAAAHYVYNMRVSPAVRSTMWFLCTHIMHIQAESTARAEAVKAVKDPPHLYCDHCHHGRPPRLTTLRLRGLL